MIKINLVPRELLQKEAQRVQSTQAVVVVAVVGLLLTGAWYLRWSQANRLEAHLADRQKRLDTLKQIVAEVEQLERTAAAVRTRLAVITDLLKGRALYPYFMADIAQTLPGSVWLSSLSTTWRDGNQLSVNTVAASNGSEGVSDWLRNIEKSGKFTDPVLSAVSINEAKVHNFSITTTYKPAPL